LAVTIGYCVVLNERLKRLHADRDVMGAMVADLVQATDLANRAVGELKASAVEADLALQSRLEEAERFGIQLANHVVAGQEVMQRIAKVAAVVQATRQPEPEATPQPAPTKLQSALQRLAERERIRSDAA
jgi:nucleotide-binding universal stress UspA family protein